MKTISDNFYLNDNNSQISCDIKFIEEFVNNMTSEDKLSSEDIIEEFTNSDEEFTDSEEEFTDSEEDFTDSEEEFTDSENEYTDSEEEFTDSEEEFTDSVEEFTNSEEEFTDSEYSVFEEFTENGNLIECFKKERRRKRKT